MLKIYWAQFTWLLFGPVVSARCETESDIYNITACCKSNVTFSDFCFINYVIQLM